MNEVNVAPPVPLEEQLHRANIIIDKLREHLHQTTEHLIAEQAENVILTESIQAHQAAISSLAQQLRPDTEAFDLNGHNPDASPEMIQEALDV